MKKTLSALLTLALMLSMAVFFTACDSGGENSGSTDDNNSKSPSGNHGGLSNIDTPFAGAWIVEKADATDESAFTVKIIFFKNKFVKIENNSYITGEFTFDDDEITTICDDDGCKNTYRYNFKNDNRTLLIDYVSNNVFLEHIKIENDDNGSVAYNYYITNNIYNNHHCPNRTFTLGETVEILKVMGTVGDYRSEDKISVYEFTLPQRGDVAAFFGAVYGVGESWEGMTPGNGSIEWSIHDSDGFRVMFDQSAGVMGVRTAEFKADTYTVKIENTASRSIEYTLKVEFTPK